MGVNFSRRAWTSRCYHSGRWFPSSRHLTLSHGTPPLPPSHRRLDKGSSSVGKEGRSGWRLPGCEFTTGGAKYPIFLAPVPFYIPSLLPTRVRPPSFSHSHLPLLSISLSWYRRLLAARKGSRARGKPAVKLKHDEGSRLRCEGERDGEGVKKKEWRRGRRQQRRRRRR